MFRNMSFRRWSIFPKLIVTFLAIMTPLSALSLVLNELGKGEVRHQISTATVSQVHNYFDALEKEIKRITKVQQEYIGDEDLLKLGTIAGIMPAYERTQAINRLQSKARILKDSSVYIEDVIIYIPRDDRLIAASSAGGDPVPKDQIAELTGAISRQAYPITYWRERLFLNFTYPFFRAPGKEPTFNLIVELSQPELKNALARFHPDGGSVLFSGNWEIAGGLSNPMLLQNERLRQLRDGKEWEKPTETLSIGNKRYLATYEKSSALEATLVVYIPEEKLIGTLKSYQTWFWLLAGCSVVILILFSYGIYLLIHRPLRVLVKQFRSVEAGNFNLSIRHNNQDEFGYLFRQFEAMVKNLKTLIDELYVQKIRLQRSELKQLQAQINPHFLYNSFFILHRLIQSYDNEKAEIVSRNLGDYFQYITRDAQDEVDLETEISHSRSYVEIQSIRFAGRIDVAFDLLPDAYADVSVPRLILQPVLENAYQHGLGEIMEHGKLDIRFRSENDRLRIEVEDNGPGLSPEAARQLMQKLRHEETNGESTGIVNVHRRLQLKYGPRGGIDIAQGERGGLLVSIYIPMEEGNDHVPSIDRGR
ncbi:sensor histidine kinase [Paenibacillus contaminans]|uniref:histidine kinase n=1 Tax=Paenibacillus contaminans TaxID=450362 RepID=A0A329M2Y6_9BACL|nr:sensor histidine kinase [Paenibacillus contaminans]RAV14391.1 hypothetical protein DQG23_31340 [Paenibacillus contaminans]